MAIKPLKTIRSYKGHAAFLAECDTDRIGDLLEVREINRPEGIPSPYSSSPVWPVYRWNGIEVVVRETAHRCYMVFDVSSL